MERVFSGIGGLPEGTTVEAEKVYVPLAVTCVRCGRLVLGGMWFGPDANEPVPTVGFLVTAKGAVCDACFAKLCQEG
jgi:hypothetical protein